MSRRGLLDEYESDDSGSERESGPLVQVTVRVEHKTARAVQVSQDGGLSVVWVPLEAIHGRSRPNFGPGDTLRIDITERLAEEKGLT